MSDHYDRYNGMENLLSTNLASLGTDVPDKNVGGLISRQSAVDELVKMLSDCFYADEEVLDAVETTLKELPSAQPEIVRCKDCKYWREDHTCKEHSLVSPMLANDFCSRAERRTDE